MTIAIKLKELRLSLHKIGLLETVNQLIDLLGQLPTGTQAEKIGWLQNEREGYAKAPFPPAYIPLQKATEGTWRVTGLVESYRMQTGFQKEKQVSFANKMGVGEIDRWVTELDDDQTAVLNKDSSLTSSRYCFNEVKQKITLRLGSLIEKVLEEING